MRKERPRFNWIFFLPELADILFLDKEWSIILTTPFMLLLARECHQKEAESS